MAEVPAAPRRALTRNLVLQAALQLADRSGLEALTMRRLARELGVEAMSLYHHVANKEDLLDGMIDLVFGEIDLPAGEDWVAALRRRARSARAVLRAHPWAVGLMETRATPGPATLRHHEAVLSCLRRAGFSIPLTAHAYAALDSYVYGFALQERNLPFETADEAAAVSGPILEQMPAGEYPYMAELITEHVLQPGYDFATEFEFGLELILQGLLRAREAERPPGS